MALPTPSIGDILMLSNLAWTIGRAFTSGRAGAPAQFEEVEKELKSLNTALTLLGENLSQDDSLLARSDDRTKEGIAKIIGSCHQSLDDLESFVEQYQEIKRPEGTRGPAQRSWRQILIRNWKTVVWTSEGGNIQQLRNILAMHTQSISLAMQALQTGSLTRLERIIEPVADKIDIMHDKLNGDLDEKIDEILMTMMNIQASMNGSPFLRPLSDGQRSVTSPSVLPGRSNSRSNSVSLLAPRFRDSVYTASEGDEEIPRDHSDQSDSETLVYSPSISPTMAKGMHFTRRPSDVGTLTTRVPNLLSEPYVRSEKPRSRSRHDSYDSNGNSFRFSPIRTPSSTIPKLPEEEGEVLQLPPPSLSPDALGNGEFVGQIELEIAQNAKPKRSSAPLEPVSQNEHASFERELLSNAVTLCDVQGLSVDYTQPDEDISGDWVMKNACTDCKICIVRKQVKTSTNAVRFMTSIWTLNNERTVRLQHRIPEDEEVIPYTVWGNDTKVVLRFETDLRYHGLSLEGKPTKTSKTAWVTYAFKHERDASSFQNALMGKTLVLSVQSKRTMRVFDGITAPFAFAEQLCGLENLRLFQEDNGLVIAMQHYVSQYGDGYLSFPLNKASDQLRIKEEGDRIVRVKGLNIPVSGGRTRRKSSAASPSAEKAEKKKPVTGISIEFCTPQDKFLFVRKLAEVRKHFY